jgi:putative ABC transport system ATP-binding protein
MIQIIDVKRTYRHNESEVKALQGISFEIQKGEFTSIAGPSGSGKTTLLNLIGCIDTLDGGQLIFENQVISALSTKEKTTFRRKNIGFIFQTYNLIPVLTAFENVAFALEILNLAKKEIEKRTFAILKEVGLEGLENRKPANLSGGQQQRVAIARALVKNPAIVLADEPTANLDSETAKDILTLMSQINEKYETTFLFSTHDRLVMEFAKRLITLRDGKIESDIIQ